ncbi:MAG: PRD domain-containing protein [Eubacterium sp.]|nr:PRD domain-containing protein [Eubacterium sp.]
MSAEQEVRVTKVLNHNALLVLGSSRQQYLILGKGVGFGRKTAERFVPSPDCSIYSLSEMTDRGNPASIVKEVDPVCLETANMLLDSAEEKFGKVDRSILFPLADHLEFAIRRLRNSEPFGNPLNDDIRVMFYGEYKVAEQAQEMIKDRLNLELPEAETGLLALHIHSSIEGEKVTQAMQEAQMVRRCVEMIEEKSGKKLAVTSLGYNRMMNHIRYMVVRMRTGEQLHMNMNDYMKSEYPEAFENAREICSALSKAMQCSCSDAEIGYLAMHIERVSEDTK